MSESPAAIQRQIDELERQKARLLAQRQQLEALSADQRIATIMHSVMCRSNHIDQCDWDYDSWENLLSNCSAREQYLNMAAKVIETGVSEADIIKVIEAL